jgi:hypothetical protein
MGHISPDAAADVFIREMERFDLPFASLESACQALVFLF